MSDQNHDKQPTESADDSPEFDQMLSQFEKVERSRRRKGIIYGVVAVLAAAAAFAAIFMFRTELFRPKMDIEGGEEKVVAKTNDPQCRQMIERVQQIADAYFKLEPTVEDKLLSDNPEDNQQIRDEIARLQQRLDEVEEYSQEANLRFDDSRQELNEWFEYVELELSFLDRLAKEELAKLKDAAADAKKESGSDQDEGGEEAPKEGVVVDNGKAEAEKEKGESAKMTPIERKRGALTALHDAFQTFRVWHSGGVHPCGAADEGEEPWEPAGAEAAPKAPSAE